MTAHAIILTLMAMMACVNVLGAEVPEKEPVIIPVEAPCTDACALIADTMPALRKPAPVKQDWWTLLKQRRLHLNDTNVIYPRFLQFCVNTYNWIDRNFNSYNPDYVRPTGKRGKVMLQSDNWTDAYYLKVREGMPIVMISPLYSNIGVAANYSILSLGYSVDLSSIIAGKKLKHKKLSIGLRSARVHLSAYYWKNEGRTALRHFGNFKFGKAPNTAFDGIKFRTVGATGLYIFNWQKFSLSTAYALSHYQIKSAGSFIAGLSGEWIDCHFDFAKLPADIYDQLHLPSPYYRFEYNSVNALAGYSYNWVMGRHWLYNITVLPGMGVTTSFENSSQGAKTLFSTILRGQTSLTYTHRQFFATANITGNGNFFLTRKVYFINFLGDFQAAVGVRF